MKRFCKICQFIIFLFLINSCSFLDTLEGKNYTASDILEDTSYSRCICIYMCGSTLEAKGYASKNIKEMLDAEIPEDTCIIIETGGSKLWKNEDISADELSRFIVDDGELNLIETLPSASMGEASTLEEFLTFCATNCNAEKMGLVFWDHGSGSNGGVCYDAKYNFDYLSLPELDKAFSCLPVLGKRLDFVGFDTCLMANYETASIMAKYADNMIASEEKEPGGGWDYSILASRYGEPDFYNVLLQTYAKKCENSKKHYYTLSHIDLTRFSELENSFKNFCTSELQSNAIRRFQGIIQSAEHSMSFGANSKSEGYSNMIDLSMFAILNGNKAIPRIIEDIVTCVNGDDRKGAAGLSFYYPIGDIDEIDSYINTISEAEYKDFLSTYYKNTATDVELIHFADKGHITSDGELAFSVTQDSIPFIKNVVYVLHQVINNTGGTVSEFHQLGTDSDVISDEKGGFTTHFGGRWVKFNKNFIPVIAIDVVDGVTIFSTDAKCNGERGSIRFSYDISISDFRLIGFVPFEEDGTLSRLNSINPGDKIEIIQPVLDKKYNAFFVVTDEFVYDESSNISVDNLDEGFYLFWCIVTDVYGKEYWSDSAFALYKNGVLKTLLVE